MTNTRKLNTDKNSKIVIYVTSHGGEGFIKVRGKSVVLSEDLNRTLIEMHSKGRYKEIIFILDTCEAYTLYDQVNKELAPNIFFIGSSLRDEKAKSINYDKDFMTPLADRFSLLLFNSLEKIYHSGNLNLDLEALFNKMRTDPLMKSTIVVNNSIQSYTPFNNYFGNANFYRNSFYRITNKRLMLTDKSNPKKRFSRNQEEFSFFTEINNSFKEKIHNYHKEAANQNLYMQFTAMLNNSKEKKDLNSTIQFVTNSFGFFFLLYLVYLAFFN